MKSSAAPTASHPSRKAIKSRECRPLEEFEGEDRELFIRCFLHFGSELLKDFQSADAANDEDNEHFQLQCLLMPRALFAAYAAMQTLGVKPKISETAAFNQKLSQ